MKQSNNKVINFFKQNVAYLVLAFCVLAVGLATTLMIISKNKLKNMEVLAPEPQQAVVEVEEPISEPYKETTAPLSETVITFSMPVANPVSVEDYSDTMVFNSTLKRYSSHKAIDFFADEGTEVFAVYGGKVESVENDLLRGVSVVIDHGNGLKTVYNSLADADDITVGKTVKAGDVIGYVSTTNRQEYSEGAHLHFEVIENGASINPAKYLTIDEK